MHALITFSRRLYNTFGGTRHAASAIFRKESRKHNGGRTVGLIRAADTRMAGHLIGLLRTLRLKPVVMSSVNSAEFIRLKLKVGKDITSVVSMDDYWHLVFIVCRSLFPLLRLLRLADQKVAAMDKLYHYVRKTDELLERGAQDLKKLDDSKVQPVLDKIKAGTRKSVDDDGSDDESDDESTVSGKGATASEDDEDWENLLDDYDGYDDANATALEDRSLMETLVVNMKASWKNRRPKLCHSFALTGFLLSPVPAIMEAAIQLNNEGKDGKIRDQVGALVCKLMIDPDTLESQRSRVSLFVICLPFDYQQSLTMLSLVFIRWNKNCWTSSGMNSTSFRQRLVFLPTRTPSGALQILTKTRCISGTRTTPFLTLKFSAKWLAV